MNSFSKFYNRKTKVDGITFDSKRESERYKELKLMQESGVIKDLELQPKFDLIPTQKFNNETLRKISYYADFSYYQDGKRIVEDVKGFKTDVYNIKKRLFIWLYVNKDDDLEFREINA